MKSRVYAYIALLCLFVQALEAQQINLEVLSEVRLFNEEVINTAGLEFSPSYWKDNIIYVHSSQAKNDIDPNINEPYFDLKFAAVGTGSSLDRSAFLPKKINSPFHEGQACFDARGNLYFTSDNYNNDNLVKDLTGTAHLQIYTISQIDGQWGEKEKWYHCTSDHSFAHPTVTPTADTLVFASDMKESGSDMDLYYSVRIGAVWSTPKALDSINSNANDWFPHYHNGYLYFASDRDNEYGMADLDVYVASFKNGVIGMPVKLPEPFNSGFDDFGFIVNQEGTSGYLSSNRTGGKGKDDIYRWEADTSIYAAEEIPLHTLSLRNTSNIGQSIPISIRWTSIEDIPINKFDEWEVIGNKLQFDLADITFQNSLDTFLINNNLDLSFLGDQFFHYEVKSSAINPYENIAFIRSSDTLSFQLSKKVEEIKIIPKKKVTILDVPVEKGTVIVFNNIYYAFNSAELQAGAQQELDLLAKAMIEDSSIKVQLSAHTDARGTESANQILSDKRAASAKAYLVSKGILSNRIYTVGFGESRLRNHCDDGVSCTEDEHRYNRRTEVKILE